MALTENDYNYRTKPFDGENPFDPGRVGVSYYDGLLQDPEYYRKRKGVVGSIEYMTPEEYFHACAKGFNSTFGAQVNRLNPAAVQDVKDVLDRGISLTVPYLNYSENSFAQEGRHRMKAVADIFGWDYEVPVLVVRDAPTTMEAQEVTVYNALAAYPRYADKYGRNDAWFELKYNFHLTNDELIWIINRALKKGWINEYGKEAALRILGISSIEESYQVLDELNPKLWQQDGTLRPEVHDKLIEIQNEFIEQLNENNIPVAVLDAWIVGSNASYNYTDQSDLDLHIIVDSNASSCDAAVLQILYNYFKSNFNSKYDISIHGIDVELYIEDVNSNAVSNGIYSLKQDKWIKKPIKADIPEVQLDSELLQKWADKYNNIVAGVSAQTAQDLVNELYLLRKQSLATEGEYGQGNLIFKEFRNNGYLDKLKEIAAGDKSKELSLESKKLRGDVSMKNTLYEAIINNASREIRCYDRTTGEELCFNLEEGVMDGYTLFIKALAEKLNYEGDEFNSTVNLWEFCNNNTDVLEKMFENATTVRECYDDLVQFINEGVSIKEGARLAKCLSTSNIITESLKEEKAPSYSTELMQKLTDLPEGSIIEIRNTEGTVDKAFRKVSTSAGIWVCTKEGTAESAYTTDLATDYKDDNWLIDYVQAEGLHRTAIKESSNISTASIQSFLEKSVRQLQEGEADVCRYILDDTFAIYMGWTGGWDAPEEGEEDNIIRSQQDPSYAIECRICVRNDFYWAELDILDRPYVKTPYGLDVWEESDVTISPNEDYKRLAEFYVRTYKDLLKDFKDGTIVTEYTEGCHKRSHNKRIKESLYSTLDLDDIDDIVSGVLNKVKKKYCVVTASAEYNSDASKITLFVRLKNGEEHTDTVSLEELDTLEQLHRSIKNKFELMTDICENVEDNNQVNRGQTVEDYLRELLIKSTQARLEKLKDIAPPTIISNSQKKLQHYKNGGKLDIKGSPELFQQPFEDIVWRTGNMGKKYAVINGSIYYFPSAKYGSYLRKHPNPEGNEEGSTSTPDTVLQTESNRNSSVPITEDSNELFVYKAMDINGNGVYKIFYDDGTYEILKGSRAYERSLGDYDKFVSIETLRHATAPPRSAIRQSRKRENVSIQENVSGDASKLIDVLSIAKKIGINTIPELMDFQERHKGEDLLVALKDYEKEFDAAGEQLKENTQQRDVYYVSYKANDVYQAILAKASSEQEAKDKVQKRVPNAEILNVRVAYAGDKKPGIPVVEDTLKRNGNFSMSDYIEEGDTIYSDGQDYYITEIKDVKDVDGYELAVVEVSTGANIGANAPKKLVGNQNYYYFVLLNGDVEWGVCDTYEQAKEWYDGVEDGYYDYDPDHAQEWMDRHPHGWYNNEYDYGVEDEEDDIYQSYHDSSEDELRKMGAFDNLNDPLD